MKKQGIVLGVNRVKKQENFLGMKSVKKHEQFLGIKGVNQGKGVGMKGVKKQGKVL